MFLINYPYRININQTHLKVSLNESKIINKQEIMKSTIIHVKRVLNDVNAVDATEGQFIYDLIIKAFFESKKVLLSFSEMEILSDEFLESAVGQLYENYSHHEIKENMLIENIPFSGKVALKRIVDKAKINY